MYFHPCTSSLSIIPFPWRWLLVCFHCVYVCVCAYENNDLATILANYVVNHRVSATDVAASFSFCVCFFGVRSVGPQRRREIAASICMCLTETNVNIMRIKIHTKKYKGKKTERARTTFKFAYTSIGRKRCIGRVPH